ncbi:unnamed protein product [Dibothriocephalus latus]|uniref:Peptidase C19 ubiquitin carboxyl-terminal hydrolase domain-containing protein n=1 Tax=Dibothriocephalus latus TaxID=60516 RepID=A0A3P7NKA0_DIBLA|nr:unnamed protein product [Dibothriocephalus latus]
MKSFLVVSLLGGTTVALSSLLYPIFIRKYHSFWMARHKSLPIGLPNNSNLCYLNALLQAMASNRSLIKSLKRSAAVRRDRLLCCLVALLEGLRCSSGYLRKHNLVEVLADAHRTFVDQLNLTEKWSVNEQQDVHELFVFLMDLANGNEPGRTEIRASGGLHSVSRLNGRTDYSSVARCCHRNSPLLFDVGSKNPIGLAEAFRQSPFHTFRITNPQYHLISNQIICTKCNYHGALKLVPEACVTIFPSEEDGPRSVSLPTACQVLAGGIGGCVCEW